MLQAIVRFSLRYRGVVVTLACALLAYGIYTVFIIPYNAFPNFAPPEVTIQTEAPGLSPQQVELLVTQPLENALNGASGIASMRSSSIQGLSVITLVFNDGTDVYRDRQGVAERLTTTVGELPTGAATPLMSPLTTSTSWVMQVGLTSSSQDLMALRTLADWTIKPRLLSVAGVAEVEVNGGEVRQLQVQFQPDRLRRYGVSVAELISAARSATGVRGAGFIETSNQRLVLETDGQAETAAELAAAVVRHGSSLDGGANITLGEVATVTPAPAPAIGDASIGGQPGVILIVDMAYGANTRAVTQALDTALAQLRPAVAAQGVTLHTNLFRAADFIALALSNVRNSLLIGAGLVVLVLLLFLFNLRTAAISCIVIPISLLAAVIVLNLSGRSLNVMTLGGLSIAIGEVVDDAVIDVENIYRRLRENRAAAPPRSPAAVVLSASLEVRSAVVYATFAVILVFFPVLRLSGLAGRLFGPLAVAYIAAILASLLAALTLTPALCLGWLALGKLNAEDPPAVHWLRRGYDALLRRLHAHPWPVMAAAAIVVVAGGVALGQLHTTFLPELREGDLTVHMTALPGTSLAASMRMGDRLTAALLRIPNVTTVSQRAGRAELGTDTMGTNESEIDVNLHARTGAEVVAAENDIDKLLASFPGAVLTQNGFLTERINETISGTTAPVVVNVFGNDLDQIDAEAGQVARVLTGIPGAGAVQLASPPGMPQVEVRLRPADLARWGFDAGPVLDVVRTAYGGDVVGQVYQGNRVFDVAVTLAPGQRGVASIGGLTVTNPSGIAVPLSQLADIYVTSGRYQILHQGARRMQSVTAAVKSGNVGRFVQTAQDRLAQLKLAPGSYLEFAGTAQESARSQYDLLINGLLAAVGIILLLSVVMGHWRNWVLVLANLPFALVGGVFAAWLTGGELSTGAMVGFITLFGITLRNSIMLLSHYEHLVATDGPERMDWGVAAALRGASERVAPILITALVTGLGLLPLALGSGDPGREIEGPLAVVILGGLVSSTALNLLVMPTLALRFGRFRRRDPLI